MYKDLVEIRQKIEDYNSFLDTLGEIVAALEECIVQLHKEETDILIDMELESNRSNNEDCSKYQDIIDEMCGDK